MQTKPFSGRRYSSQIPAQQRTCENCIFMELDERQQPFCTPSYRRQHEAIKPHCPRWDGGVVRRRQRLF